MKEGIKCAVCEQNLAQFSDVMAKVKDEPEGRYCAQRSEVSRSHLFFRSEVDTILNNNSGVGKSERMKMNCECGRVSTPARGSSGKGDCGKSYWQSGTRGKAIKRCFHTLVKSRARQGSV